MRLIKRPEVMEKTALSKASIYRKMKKAEFPERVSLEGRAVG
ncbi:AlpA family phage regulatory protein [Vibrio campbellii]|nr:AlpA family phage regulatory protein [Vibrio campbellii]